MGTKNVFTIIATASLVLIISLVFAYTKANIYSFWFGFLLCIGTQLLIFLIYCFSKLQKAYSDSNNIKLTENHQLQFEKQFPPPNPIQAKEIYLNAYTDQARLTTKKNSVQSFQFQQETEEVQIDKVPYKQKIQTYLQQIRNQYQCLNKFNQALIDYGNRMILLPKHTLLNTQHRFTKKQMCFVIENFNQELQYQEGRAFSKELKVKMMKIKTKEENGLIKIQGQNNLKNIVLPSWKMILSSFSQVGKQFKNIDVIKTCNSTVLQMVHKKIQDDYQILEKEISNSVSAISDLKLNIQNLRKQHQKLQKYETSSQQQDNKQIIYWLKKQYFEFTNLTLRIKQNEKQYKLQTQKLRYCKAKLNTFYQSQKIKYDKIIHTRCFAFLDAYRITLEESLNALRASFQEEGYNYSDQERPPKVNQPAKSKNMNELIEIEKNYQQEYFQRVDYYLKKIDSLQSNLEDLGIFIGKFRGIFAQLIDNLKLQRGQTSADKENSQERKALLMDSFFKALTDHSGKLNKVFHNLERVNKNFTNDNRNNIQQCGLLIRGLCVKVQKVTLALDQTGGPLRQKYRIIRQQLNHFYKQIEQLISSIKQFEGIAARHSNRIKKILLAALTLFITEQQKWVIFYLYNDDKLKNMLNQSDMEQPNLLETTNQNKLEEELTLEKLNSLETGVLFAEEYRLLINRFFFVAYTQWSQSQLFRFTISKQIYIALNEDISEYFSQIVVQDFQSSGLPPQVIWIKQLNHDDGQFIIDLNLAFKGKVVIKISTKIIAFLTIPVQFQLQIEQFYAILRLCFIHNEMGCSWFSFVGEPLAKLTVFPKIGNLPINMTNVTNLLQNSILASLKKFIYPIKKKISIPLFKKDDSYESIQKRYQSMRI